MMRFLFWIFGAFLSFALIAESARGEEFFATAQEALIMGEIVLKKNGVDPKELILFRMEIRPAPSGKLSPEIDKIYQDFGKRDAWQLSYQPKVSFKPTMNYGFSHVVLIFSKTEAAMVRH